jgi:hypothetical protein
VGVADFYRGLLGTLIVDEADAQLGDIIRGRGINVRVATTIMAEPANARRLAHEVLA